MKPVLLLLCFLYTSAVSGQQLILSLDRGYPEDQFYFLTYNAEISFTLRSQEAGFQGKSVEANWKIVTTGGDMGYAGFGYLHPVAAPSNPFPDLTGFTHLSLWYDNAALPSVPGSVTFRFELHENTTETDASGVSAKQVWIHQTDAVMRGEAGWRQLLLPLQQSEALGEQGFALPPGGFRGDGKLDLDDIKYWSVILLVEGRPRGTVIEGRTRFDHLTAIRSVDVEGAPGELLADALQGAFPNPFRASTSLRYSLQRPSTVSLRLYDLLGREVATLVDRQEQPAGSHEVRWDREDLAAGSYLCVLDIGGTRLSRMVTRLR